MAVAFETSVIGGGNGVNSFTFAALTTSGTNRLLVAVIHYSNATPTGITFSGGTGLTWTLLQARVANNNSSTNGYVEAYYALASSTQSAQVITATLTGGGFPQTSGTLAVFSGQDTSGTNGAGAIGAKNSSFGSAANPSISLTTTAANSLVIGLWGETNNLTYTAGASQINTGFKSGGTVSATVVEYQNAVTASSGTLVTMSETVAAANYAVHALEIKASAGAVAAASTLMMMGVGA